jgi:OOP family OmpA-OmpF porin
MHPAHPLNRGVPRKRTAIAQLIRVRNIRVAAGGKDLYDALSKKGRGATQGIFFDTGSDRIRPESAPTLKQISEMLKTHADLKLTIEGHTDDVGDDAANQTLSEKRAAAVKAHLVSTYGIDAARLDSTGLGESKPAASNDSAEGRQQNRRVELVKK